MSSNTYQLSQSWGLQYTRTIKIGHFKSINSHRLGPCTIVKRLINSLPVDALIRFECGSYAMPALEGEYDLLWWPQKNLQHLQIDFNVLPPNAEVSLKMSDVLSQRDLSELKIDFGQSCSPIGCG